ncbi:hypothetical protein BDA99DRAFT_485705 [Phascolomyces articulosus]|uniref:Uncharacterized protein n=1 Tax=Phascolomyces articulosus TaxID=60185 RepID=A0AAD5PD30_9FUNG|nr:hypothetical protein BDA99DRAFT_485705 [Phascolomyces articulosus]
MLHYDILFTRRYREITKKKPFYHLPFSLDILHSSFSFPFFFLSLSLKASC